MSDDLSRCRMLAGTRGWVDIPALSGEAFPDLQQSAAAAAKPAQKPAVSAFADGGRRARAS
eukprot:91721-Alexandrium_andersonii.AAC.1